MTDLKHLFYALTLVLSLTACGGDEDEFVSNEENNKTEQDNNKNRNTVTTDAAVSRMEFPKLKGGNSIVIVHRTTGYTKYDSDAVNYAIEWDTDKKSQRWACYQMHDGYTSSNVSRYSGKRPDNMEISTFTGEELYPKNPLLDDSYYLDKDYFYGSGYEHGHICPSADRLYSTTANKQTFYLTNMQPQYRRFNGYSTDKSDSGNGLWLRLENEVRNWTPSNSTDTLFVCKGGTIDNESDIIERIKGYLIVPKYFFVACLMRNSSGYRAIAFFMEQKNQWGDNENLTDYTMTIDELETRTGIDFFCNLPDDVETEVEGKLSLLSWGLK